MMQHSFSNLSTIKVGLPTSATEILYQSKTLNIILKTPCSKPTKNMVLVFLIVLKESNLSIGLCGLVNRSTLDNIDIGFALLDEECGKGYGYLSASNEAKAF